MKEESNQYAALSETHLCACARFGCVLEQCASNELSSVSFLLLVVLNSLNVQIGKLICESHAERWGLELDLVCISRINCDPFKALAMTDQSNLLFTNLT